MKAGNEWEGKCWLDAHSSQIHFRTEPDKNKYTPLLTITLQRMRPENGEILVKGRDIEENNGTEEGEEMRGKSQEGTFFLSSTELSFRCWVDRNLSALWSKTGLKYDIATPN